MDERIKQLEIQSMKVKQLDNSNGMVITNLPKIENVNKLKKTIMEIGKQIGYDLQQSEIVNIQQNRNEKCDTYPIIVKMTNNEFKIKCMQYRRNKNKINIKEIDETFESTDKNVNFHHLLEKDFGELLNMVKEVAKKKKYKFVWFRDATILIRKEEKAKVIAINSKADLSKVN